MAHPHSGSVFSSKKEGALTHTMTGMHLECDAECQSQTRRADTVWSPFYKMSKMQIQRQGADWWLPGSGEEEDRQ